MRHRQTKGPGTDRLDLHHRATSRLYEPDFTSDRLARVETRVEGSMRFSTINLNGPRVELPLRFPIKLNIEYRPYGTCQDVAPILDSNDPEKAAGAVVRERGWDRLPGYDPKDVWVNGCF